MCERMVGEVANQRLGWFVGRQSLGFSQMEYCFNGPNPQSYEQDGDEFESPHCPQIHFQKRESFIYINKLFKIYRIWETLLDQE